MHLESVVAACRGPMPTLPTRVAKDVRALAEWIVAYADTPRADAQWLTKLYDETIGWLLGAFHAHTSSTAEDAVALDLKHLPKGRVLASATALLRSGVRRELLNNASGRSSNLRVVWSAAVRGEDEVATLETHGSDVRRLERAIRECEKLLLHAGASTSKMIEAGTTPTLTAVAVNARPPRLGRLMQALPDRVRRAIVDLATELRRQLRSWHAMLHSRPEERARVWHHVLGHLHAHHCTVGALGALVKSPTLPMLEGCTLGNVDLEHNSASTARRLSRADVRRALQELALRLDLREATEIVRDASTNLAETWSSQARGFDAPRAPQIEMGTQLDRYRLWLPRLTVDAVRERSTRTPKKPKEKLAVYIDEKSGWHEGTAREFRADGSVDVAYKGGEVSVADERGKLPAGVEVGGAEVSCPPTRRSKIVASLVRGIWREGRLRGCADAIVVQFHGSEKRRTVPSARYIEWLRIPAESVAKGHVLEIPHESKLYTRDLIRAGMHDAVDMSRPAYERALQLSDDLIEAERDRAILVEEAKQDANDQLVDADEFLTHLEEDINIWRERMNRPRGTKVTERALVASTRRPTIRSLLTAEQFADVGAVLDYVDYEIETMRHKLEAKSIELEALEADFALDEHAPTGQIEQLGTPQSRAKLRAIASWDELRDRTERLSELLEQCFQRFWDFLSGVEHPLPESADVAWLLSDMPTEPGGAARRLLEQQGIVLRRLAAATGRLLVGDGPARATGLLHGGNRTDTKKIERERIKRDRRNAYLGREHHAKNYTRVFGGVEDAPGSADASKHERATVDEVKLFSKLEVEKFAGARVTVRFNLPDGSGRSAWFAGAVDNMHADGSLDVYYDHVPDPSREDVPASEVEEGNVRWERWTEPMARIAIETFGARTKIGNVIDLSFREGDAQRAALIEAAMAVKAARVQNDDKTGKRTEPAARRPRRVIEDDDDDGSSGEYELLKRELDSLRPRAGNNDPVVLRSLAALRERVLALASGPERATLDALASKIKAENEYVLLSEFGRLARKFWRQKRNV